MNGFLIHRYSLHNGNHIPLEQCLNCRTVPSSLHTLLATLAATYPSHPRMVPVPIEVSLLHPIIDCTLHHYYQISYYNQMSSAFKQSYN